MRYLKSYRLFESNQVFANSEDIKDILIELLDDNIISKCEFIDSGYLYFPYLWTRQIQSDLYYDMANYPQTWYIRKPDELLGQTWQELFLDPESVFMTPSGVFKSCDNRKEYIFLDDVKNSVSKIRQSGLSNKTKDELFIENIENGKIKAYSIMMFSIGDFDKKDLPEIVDSLKRVYQATGFRPLKGFWLEDYVDEDNGDVVTIGRGEVEFVKCSDKSYQVLRSTLSENDITKVVTHHFL